MASAKSHADATNLASGITTMQRLTILRDAISEFGRLMAAVKMAYKEQRQQYTKQGHVDTAAKIQKLESQVETIIQTIHNGLNSGEDHLKKLREQARRDDLEQILLADDIRVMAHQLRVMGERFWNTLEMYRTEQRRARELRFELAAEVCRVIKPDITDEVIRHVMENPELLDSDLTAAENAYRDIQDRHGDIQRLEESVTTLHEITVDLAIFVDRQGKVIDNVQANTERAADHAVEVRQELTSAVQYQRNARKTKLCVCVWMFVLGAMIAIIITLTKMLR